MIHIVSGFMRTGTSAMMSALIAGGMDAAWSEQRDKLAESKADEHYHPNKSGLYEVSLREYSEPTFPLQYQGKLIKVMVWGTDGLAVNPEGYRVILMQRDKEEIRQSFEAFFEKPLRMPWFEQYEQRMDRAFEMLLNRRDVLSVHRIQYRKLVNDPNEVLEYLARRGWPIDVAKSSVVIDPEQCRFRRENLTVGI